MRARLVFPPEWLPNDYDPPERFSGKESLTVFRIHREARADLLGMKLTRGAGVWNSAGRLLHFLDKGADLGWAPGSGDLYSLENRFGPCQGGNGIRHALRALETGSFRPLKEMEVCVPTGAVHYLVLGRKGSLALATWLDQTEWGYVTIDYRLLRQHSVECRFASSSLAPPSFSPDESLVVSCSPWRNGWWTDREDDYWEHPSPGGTRKLGTIAVHNVKSNDVSLHELTVDLPPNWIPDRPEASEWNVIWGPEFVGDREFKIWLPDGSTRVLQLPLPPRIDISRPLGAQRQWQD